MSYDDRLKRFWASNTNEGAYLVTCTMFSHSEFGASGYVAFCDYYTDISVTWPTVGSRDVVALPVQVDFPRSGQDTEQRCTVSVSNVSSGLYEAILGITDRREAVKVEIGYYMSDDFTTPLLSPTLKFEVESFGATAGMIEATCVPNSLAGGGAYFLRYNPSRFPGLYNA